MKFLIQRFSLLMVCVLAAFSMSAQNTTITFDLTDSFGDGWCGGNLIVSGMVEQVTGADGACAPILEPVPFTKQVGTSSGFTTGTTWQETCNVAVGTTVSITWMDDPFNGETGYTITNGNGTVEITGGGGSGLPASFIAAGPPIVCPNCPPTLAGASLEFTGVDGFGDGWDIPDGIVVDFFSMPGGAGDLCGSDNALEDFTGGTTGMDVVSGLPAGGSAVLTWSASCSAFPGEVEELTVDLVLGPTVTTDPVTGACVETPGMVVPMVVALADAAGICTANTVIATLDFPAGGGGLICPADSTVVLADGDCWPVVEYCLGGVDLLLPPINMADQACPGFVSDPIGLDLSSTVPCNGLFDVDVATNTITLMTSNGPGGTTGCDDVTCPGATFPNSGLALTTVPVTVPPGYDELVVDYTLFPDCTGNFGEDQFSYYVTDATGTTIASIVFLVNFGASGIITGTETIDVSQVPAGAKVGFYMLTNTAPGINGSATAEIVGQFVDQNGSIFAVGAENVGCDTELTYEVDYDAGTVTIDYIPGVNEVCFLISDPDGCNAETCSFTFTVDNSDIKQALACNNGINVSVDENCEAFITADMVLEGGPYYGDCEYIIEITTPSGIPVSNPIVYDPSYDNNEYIVSVIDPYTCNNCWGTIVLEDKLPPSIECPCPPGAWLTDPACNQTCLNVTRLLSGQTGRPSVADNCAGVVAVFNGATVVPGFDCGEYVVTQTWTTEIDGYNGGSFPSVTCTNEYYVTAADLDAVTVPPAAEFECTDLGDPDLTHPSNTGYPRLGGDQLGTEDGGDNPYCNIFATYSDLEIPACGTNCNGPIKVLRTWTILDWCTQEVREELQTIKVIDSEAPTLQADDIFTSTDPWVCSTDIWFDGVSVHDNCSYGLDWYIQSHNSGATLVDANGSSNSSLPKKHALGVPKGTWTFTLASTDCCGMTGTTDITVTVVDLTPPVAVATQNLVISLTSSGSDTTGTAKIFAHSINNGSHDNCSDVVVEIRRDSDPCGVTGNDTYSDKLPASCDQFYSSQDHDYGDYVKFCCEDLTADGDGDGEADGLVKVWMRVWDDGNMDGIYGSFTQVNNPGNDHDYCTIDDNYNETWAYVKVEDKGVPNIICPPDITIPCDWDYTDMSITGNAAGSALCQSASLQYTDWPEIHCGEGYVLREFYIEGYEDYKCVQRITIEPLAIVPLADRVTCPIDPQTGTNKVIVDCEGYDIPDPFVSESACSLAAINSDIDTFWFEEGACYKVIKTWRIIDWCSGEEFACDFTVSLIDTEAPEIMCQDTCIAVDDYWDADNDGNYCELANNITLTNSAGDPGACGSEWIKWIIEIDYWADGTTDAVASSFVPPSAPNYKAPTAAGADVSMTLRKDDASAEWARHIVKWKAFDGCGNVSQCSQLVEVADKKAPTPYCIGISTALMDTDPALVEIWACDFNLGSFDNCSSEEELYYTFDETPPNVDKIDQVHCFDASGEVPCSQYENGFPVQRWDPVTQCSGTKFVEGGNTGNGGSWCGENDIRISVWDAKFNTDFCWVTLIIHGEVCDDGSLPRADIAGTIATEGGETVELVEITNNSPLQPEYPLQDMTAADGYYAFMDNLNYNTYLISAEKRDDWRNGVSTLDLVLIQRHILGLQSLDSGYKLIAADINSDENISGVDLVELRKLILGIYDELPQNDSWRFPVEDQGMTMNPWPFVETIDIQGLNANMMHEDFVGVKIGDVNGDVTAHNYAGGDTENRSANTVGFVVEDMGQGLVEVRAGSNFTDVYGYQFTMNLGGDLAGVRSGAISVDASNFGLLGNGVVTTSYANVESNTIAEGDVLFTLEVNGNNNLSMVSGITAAEAYVGKDLEVVQVEMRDGEGQVAEYMLSQNEPNPFGESTQIAFTLGQAGPATLTVMDVTGKVVKVIAGTYDRGTHVVEVSKKDLGTSGVMYYQLESGDFTATKKMIVIE